eukprot:COSAG06_NODE_23282_length_697_cov_0.734114_1_plen_139_part_00
MTAVRAVAPPAGEMSVRRVANLRTLSLSERERRTEAEMQVARSASQSSQLDEELSTVRKQISLLVQVEGLPITEHPMPDGSPAAPRKGRLNWPTYTPRTHGHTHTHARSMPATGNWLQLATGNWQGKASRLRAYPLKS